MLFYIQNSHFFLLFVDSVRQAQIANMRGGRGVNGRMMAAATPASVLRQQVFHFGSEVPPDYQAQPQPMVGAPGPLGAYPGPDLSAGYGLGRGMPPTGLSAGPSISGASIAGTSVYGQASNGYQQQAAVPRHVPGQSSQQQQQQQYMPPAASQYIPRHTDNEEMLRQLFPGWF